jgi:hypothetical protein
VSTITRDDPYSTAYDLYGDPHKLVEFRLFCLNECSMACKGCFYNKIQNDFTDFAGSLSLAEELKANDYQLETCYLLPTDIFDNKDNYLLFDRPEFRGILNLFSYVGIAATLEEGYDPEFFDLVYGINDSLKVELQVNLSIKRLFDITYEPLIKRNILLLKERYGDRIVINLAINTGFKLADKEIERLKELLSDLSEDGIIELNFTFLYNPRISEEKKRKMLISSIQTVNTFGAYYESKPSFDKKYNNRTFLRKPSFAFLGSPNRVYANPILPFDEYVFVEDESFLLDEPTYEAFLNCYGTTSAFNFPVDDDCESCQNLSYCMGKHYFSIANTYDLGCFLKLTDK